MDNQFFNEFKKKLIISLIIIGVLGLIGGIIAWRNMCCGKSSVKTCTQESKQCPDGSYVGRTGPNCEFALCSEISRCESGSDCSLVYIGEEKRSFSCDMFQGEYRCLPWEKFDQIRKAPYVKFGAELNVCGFTHECVCDDGICRKVLINDTGGRDGPISIWQTYRNEEYRFEVSYPLNWQIDNVPGSILRLVDSTQRVASDTDQPRDLVVIGTIKTACKNSDWEIGFAQANWKTICLTDSKLFITMEANSGDAKILTEQILSTFRFIK